MNVKTLAFALSSTIAFGVFATDYYVAETGNDDNDGSAEAPYLTIDKAVVTARTAGDVIHVMPGTYETTLGIAEYGDNAKWGPNVAANVKLIGEGETRDAVVLKSHGNHRTLRMEANSWVENMTLIGEPNSKADKGGVIEMNGGTLTNCVVKSGTTSGNGGSIYMTSGLVVDCHISGSSGKEGGQIYMTNGTIKDCTVLANGTTTGSGGGIYMDGSGATVEDCTIDAAGVVSMAYHGGCIYMKNGTVRNTICKNGTCTNGDSREGGNIYMEKGTLENCVIKNGTATGNGGNIYMTGGTVQDCTILDGFIDSTNTAWNGPKGANVQLNGASAKLIRCLVSGGRAKVNEETELLYYERGSVAYNNESATVEDCLIAGSQCGGVLMQFTGGLYNSTVVDNNGGFGVWAWNDNGKVVNCVIYGNKQENGSAREWHGDLPKGSSATFWNNAAPEGVFSATTYPTVQAIDESAFVDYANGDYRPNPHRPNPLGALVDNGGADPRGTTSASATDLAGNPRMSGPIDIGCYEYQKQDMTVRLESGEYSQIWAPTTVTFTHVVEHSASPETVVVTYDFGDGSEPVSTKASSVAHDYAKAGVYTVKLTATNECEEESAEMTYTGYVRVASSTVYVKAGNAAAAYPYDTPETAYANLKTACNEAYNGYTIKVGAGAYEWGDQLSITKALRIVGTEEDVAKVVFRNTNLEPNTYYHRTVELNNAEAFLANVTIENGCVKNQYGGNLRIAGGACVSNCVIRGGLAVADNGNAAGAGVVLSGQNSTITHCTITGNTVRGTSNDQNYAGGAVFIEYGVKNIHLSNLLIVDNTYESTDSAKHGTAGVRYGGYNNLTTMENCTIAGNKVTGAALPDDSAAVYCTSWHVLFYNNIFVGNVETEKEGGKATSVKFIYDGGSNYKYMSNITDDALIEGSTTKSIGNMIADPKVVFKDFAKGDYTLPPTSPACNKGTTTGLALRPAIDLLGNPREFGKAIDIGCYECQRLPGLAILIK